eukprot:jgi/Chrzof1/3880/Cz13g11340.t1
MFNVHSGAVAAMLLRLRPCITVVHTKVLLPRCESSHPSFPRRSLMAPTYTNLRHISLQLQPLGHTLHVNLGALTALIHLEVADGQAPHMPPAAAFIITLSRVLVIHDLPRPTPTSSHTFHAACDIQLIISHPSSTLNPPSIHILPVHPHTTTLHSNVISLSSDTNTCP